MKRALSIIAGVLFALSAYADGGSSLLAGMSGKLRAMGEYEVEFSVKAGAAFKIDGSYVVSGREYYLTLGDAEVFCDGTTRYEVNHSLEEITVDNINMSERNILNNPVGGLEFLDEEFASAVVSQSGSETVVRLTPRNGADGSVIDVTVSRTSQLPTRLVYRLNGDAITVDLNSIKAVSSSLRRFDPKAYGNYEIIDFR